MTLRTTFDSLRGRAPRATLAIVVFTCIVIGAGMVIFSKAATSTLSLEAENGVMTGGAAAFNDSSASGTKSVRFSAPAPDCTGGVEIKPTDNAQAIVNANPAGTKYIVKTGTHQSNFSVTPKNGDTYCGEPGNIIDGGRTLVKAFKGLANNVTLDSLVVQNYNTGRQAAAIGPVVQGTGWVVRNVTARNNYWAGLALADGMKVLGGHYVDNDQLGISAGDPADRDAIGALLDGFDNDLTTYDGPEMARNHCMHEECGWEAGGMKGLSDMTIRNTYVHDNDSFGLWADINDMKTLVEYNRVENNGDAGIYIEISQDACIRHNRVTGNGKGNPNVNWYWGGGITIPESFNVEIYGNTLTDNFNGITGVQQDRFDSTPPAHLLNHMYVHDNTVSGSGLSGVISDNGADLTTRDIVYKNNSYLNGHQGFTKQGTGYAACSLLGYGND